VKFAAEDSLDAGGYSFSAAALGQQQVGDGVVFHLGEPNLPDAISSGTVNLPGGHYSSVKVLAAAVEGNQAGQTFVVNYADGASATFNQSLHDWAETGNYRGESIAAELPYRATADGSEDGGPFYTRAYSFALDSSKTVRGISLPANRNVVVLAITLVPAAQ
jgi:hypothetical protein